MVEAHSDSGGAESRDGCRKVLGEVGRGIFDCSQRLTVIENFLGERFVLDAMALAVAQAMVRDASSPLTAAYLTINDALVDLDRGRK